MKIRESAEGIIKENKQLKGKVVDLEKKISQHGAGASQKAVTEDLESRLQ